MVLILYQVKWGAGREMENGEYFSVGLLFLLYFLHGLFIEEEEGIKGKMIGKDGICMSTWLGI